MRYDRIRRVLVVVVAGLLVPAALFSDSNPDSAGTRPANSTPNHVTSNAAAISHARVVYVSFVNGAVTIRKPGSAETENALLNMPITEGEELSTAPGSFVELQFENGSTARLSASSRLLIQQLAVDADGGKLNGLTLESGTAGFHFVPEHHDVYQVRIADTTLTADGKTEIDTSFDAGKMRLFVLEGEVTIAARSHSLILGKWQTLEYEPSDASAAAKSHARVVRLSFLSGTVMLKRPESSEPEKAMLNTPIQEGFELSTAADSYAEVEFENGSTARLGELSKLLFHLLALDAKGNKLNGIIFERGYATFHFLPGRTRTSSSLKHPDEGVIYFLPTSTDVYQVKVADATIATEGKCEFRTDLGQEGYRVEVFHGAVSVSTPTETAELTDGKILDHKYANAQVALNIHKGIVKDNWDRWTDARDRQVLLTERDESVSAPGPRYGWSDLNTYGEWLALPGGRFGWSPYSRAGWSPFTNGRWDWYSGYGWTWLSGDPWGWVTDHCGAWDFDASFGWFWTSPMFGCGLWEPALVSWYSGPGWVGWRPRTHPAPATGSGARRGPPGGHQGPRAGQFPRGLVAVPTSVVQNRQMITPQALTQVQLANASVIAHPGFGPSPRPGLANGISAPPAAGRLRGSAIATAPPTFARGDGAALGFGSHHGSAPSTLLMGGNAVRESALLNHSGHSPLRSFEGTTLGGRLAVHGTPGEFRGNAFVGGRHGGSSAGGPIINSPFMSHSFGSASGPAIMPHASSGGGHAMGGGYSGGAARSGGYSGGGGYPGGGHSMGGGGYAGGGHASGGSGGGFSGGGGGGHAGGGGGGSAGGGGGHH